MEDEGRDVDSDDYDILLLNFAPQFQRIQVFNNHFYATSLQLASNKFFYRNFFSCVLLSFCFSMYVYAKGFILFYFISFLSLISLIFNFYLIYFVIYFYDIYIFHLFIFFPGAHSLHAALYG